MVLYEWDVVTELAGECKRSPVGVSDEEERACDQMLAALRAVPSGVPSTGWVTAVTFSPGLGSYMRYKPRMRAWRDACGAVRWDAGDHDA